METRKLKAQIPTKISQVDNGRWRASNDGLGIYAYGETIDDATQGLLKSLDAITETFVAASRMGALHTRFRNAGIELTVETEIVFEAPVVGGSSEMQVPFGKVLQNV